MQEIFATGILATNNQSINVGSKDSNGLIFSPGCCKINLKLQCWNNFIYTTSYLAGPFVRYTTGLYLTPVNTPSGKVSFKYPA